MSRPRRQRGKTVELAVAENDDELSPEVQAFLRLLAATAVRVVEEEAEADAQAYAGRHEEK